MTTSPVLRHRIERALCRSIGCTGPLSRWFTFGGHFCTWWNFDRLDRRTLRKQRFDFNDFAEVERPE